MVSVLTTILVPTLPIRVTPLNQLSGDDATDRLRRNEIQRHVALSQDVINSPL